MKQGHVAREAKITQAHLSRIENDESGVTEHTLKKIAEVIGENFEDIVIRKDISKGPGVMSIDDVLSSESAMVRFLNGERPDKETLRLGPPVAGRHPLRKSAAGMMK